MHLAVYPPNGRVRVAVPLHVTDDNVRLAVINKLGWIRIQAVLAESRQSQREMVTVKAITFGASAICWTW